MEEQIALIETPRDKKRARDARYRHKLKRECLEAYGGVKCSEPSCEETRLEILELHHIEGGGNEDRARRVGRGLRSPGGWNFYQKLKREGYPPGFRVICTPHHDKIHGRFKGSRLKCAPGEDPTRKDDLVPF